MRKTDCRNFLKNATDYSLLFCSLVLKQYHLLKLPFSDHPIENYNAPMSSLNESPPVHPPPSATLLDN